MAKNEVDIESVLSRVDFNMEIKTPVKDKIRLWIAARLFRLGARILQVGKITMDWEFIEDD